MSQQHIAKTMYTKAIELIESRYPKGWGGAAVVRTAAGNFYTSVALETANAAASLCIETGAMIEAHKYRERVTHCLCLVRDDENSDYKVLSPCGICQERLRYWGEQVKVAVTNDAQQLLFVTLDTLMAYHWTRAYSAEEIESYDGEK